MATTADVSPQSEDDKLGPLGTAASVLQGDLRSALLDELLGAAEAARDAARGAAANPAEAVHAYRKSLRRARAVLSLVSRALPKRERQAVKKSLQDARRSVSAIRDHAVAPDALAGAKLPDDIRATADLVLAQAAAAQPGSDEIVRRLQDGAVRAVAQVEALEAALPRILELRTIVRGMRDIYADARAARRRARRGKDAREFHRWRRRTKELVYQLQLLGRWAGERTEAIHDRFERVGDDLSDGVDLIMLGDFIATYGDSIAAAPRAALEDAIADQRDTAMTAARHASKGVFSRSPKAFARKLARAVRRDIESTKAVI